MQLQTYGIIICYCSKGGFCFLVYIHIFGVNEPWRIKKQEHDDMIAFILWLIAD